MVQSGYLATADVLFYRVFNYHTVIPCFNTEDAAQPKMEYLEKRAVGRNKIA